MPIALLAFVSLGLPDGVLGVAWPSIRASFGLPVSQLGALLAAATAGYLVSSFSTGALVARLGVGRLLLGSSAVMVGSSLAHALSPVWPVMLVGACAAGLGAGAIDAGLNAFAAARFSAGRTAWLHAAYGIGAMLGPLLMTAAIAGPGWRTGYAAIAAILAGMTIAFALTRARWRVGDPGARALRATMRESLRQPVVGLHAALFLVYAGLEVTAGQWAYSLFTEARGVSPVAAGIWVSCYWGALTAGRIGAGFAARRVSVDALLRGCLVAAPLAAALLWAGHGTPAMLGLLGLGLALAPIFPLLISATPARVGDAHAAHAVGFQVAAAYVGVAALPGLVGVLAAAWALEVVGPSLVALALVLLALHEIALRRARTTDAGTSPPARPAAGR